MATAASYVGFWFPAEIISHAVWLYYRFALSFRDVSELMLVRGVVVSHETIRQWTRKFGQTYANGLRRRRPRPGDRWHLDEVVVKINGAQHYLWRAVDQDGVCLDVLVQRRRNAKAAKKFFRKLLKGLRYAPRVLVTDKLGSYQVAHREILSSAEHRRSKYLNNRAENSHQPTRVRERVMKRFHSFTAWCVSEPAATRPGEINLRGLRPMITAEFQWALCAHAQQPRQTRWAPGWVQALVNRARQQGVGSLGEVDTQQLPYSTRTIIKTMLEHLRPVYFTPAQTREAGFIETAHFGVRFSHRLSQISLAGVPQRWLRELLWDYLAALLSSPRCPRGREAIDGLRRGAIELGVFLELDAPGGGHDPRVLSADHMRRFVADQRHRAREGMSSLAMKRVNGTASTVTDNTRVLVFNAVRRLLRDAMDRGEAERLGLGREFIVAMPTAGGAPRPARRPYTDEAARALADPANLARLHEVYDPDDLGLRDAWETIVLTGRRVSEVLQARWDCLGRYGGLAMFWHDQTKVGNYDAAIRIPERLYELLAVRQGKTLDRFITYHGRRPHRDELAGLALFPSNIRNPEGTGALTYQWFHFRFRSWVDELDLGPLVAHQARHTLATNLMRTGASLSHVRRYLGQISNQMAEHYIHLTQADLENVLQQVWVTGPGSANPGERLTGPDTALTREQAQALAVDLSRRSTPAEGGFCTFQPVVDGGACPWNLNCHHCDNFVLSGADLLYWRRKREQWRLLAEGAPDDATADYLHTYFEPTARAIDGLEKALAGLGLLDDALALDLRKPQDYFQRVWATAFRAADLATNEQQHNPDGDEHVTAGKEPRT